MASTASEQNPNHPRILVVLRVVRVFRTPHTCIILIPVSMSMLPPAPVQSHKCLNARMNSASTNSSRVAREQIGHVRPLRGTHVPVRHARVDEVEQGQVSNNEALLYPRAVGEVS